MRQTLVLTAIAHVVPAAAVAVAISPWAGLAFAAAGIAAAVPLTNEYLRGDKRSRWRTSLVDVPYFVHWTSGLIALPIALVALVLASAKVALVASWAIALVIAMYGAFVRRRFIATRRIAIPIVNLDKRFDGYRIVQLSDLHIGPWTPRAWGMRWVRAANALAPDLTVVTGDMVSNGASFHDDIADIVGSLRAKDGVVVALGNHDYSAGAVESLVDKLRARGVRVLRNEGELLERGGEHVYLAAIDDRWSKHADLDEALRARPEAMPSILLAHDPEDFPAAAARGVDLVLSGHTHGGQLALPFAARHANLMTRSHKHTLGVYHEHSSTLVVHPGLGTSGPPVRIGVAPALIELTLRVS